MKKKHKIFRNTFFILLFTGILLFIALTIKNIAFTPLNPQNETWLYITPEDDFSSVVSKVDSLAHPPAMFLFRRIALREEYQENIKTGRYRIHDISLIQLLKNLISGNQTPVRIKFNNIRTKEELAGKLSSQLMADSVSFLNALNDPEFCRDYGFSPETILSVFIPNTYEVYWNTSVERFVQKMYHEYNLFWTNRRQELAVAAGLSMSEVSILASIVEEESKDKEEQPIIAGLYLNRLKKDIPLQADPTVKFATGDFTLTRILKTHLDTDSPYNTYIYAGLPPGPIRMPSIQAIDAVLNYKDHNYLYMCAKEDFSGKHNFAETFEEHSRNAARYQRELNKRKIF